MMRKSFAGICLLAALPSLTMAAVTSVVSHDANPSGFAAQLSATDLLAGLIGDDSDPRDSGWHPANPQSSSATIVPEGLPTFTDGASNLGLFGLLNDFPEPRGEPVKVVEYDLGGTFDVGRIHVLTGNEGRDGRVFASFLVVASTDGGSTFLPLEGYTPSQGTNFFGYFESNIPGQTNNGGPNDIQGDRVGATWTQIFDDSGAALASDVTHLRFEFFSVDNTLGEFRDPFDGLNPFTGFDDGLTSGFVSPLVWEIDVLPLGPRCDFDGDGLCQLADLNSLLAEGPIAPGVPAFPGINAQFDLTGDSVIDNADVDAWLAAAATENGLASPYRRGDANLDGLTDVSDFNLWNGGKFTASLQWDGGDFNGDGQVDVSDFNLWNSAKFTASTSAVPEPCGWLGLLGPLAWAAAQRLRRRGRR